MASKRQKASIRKAVFPVAGTGLRMRPISRVVQKEFLPIGTKALIHFAVQEAVDSGIEEIHFLMRRDQRHDYFSPQSKDELESGGSYENDGLQPVALLARRASFVYHTLPPGVGGFGDALLAAERLVGLGQEPFALVLFDDFVDAKKPCLRQIIEAYESVRATVFAVKPISRREIPEFGVVRCGHFQRGISKVLGAFEKPDPRVIAGQAIGIVGRYVLMPSIFEALRRCADEENISGVELTPALDALAKSGSVFAAHFEGQYIHAGTEAGYLRTVVYYAIRRSKYAPIMRRDVRRLLEGDQRRPHGWKN